MIFVTVGTHEQPFNRLIQKVDAEDCDFNFAVWRNHFYSNAYISESPFISA